MDCQHKGARFRTIRAASDGWMFNVQIISARRNLSWLVQSYHDTGFRTRSQLISLCQFYWSINIKNSETNLIISTIVKKKTILGYYEFNMLPLGPDTNKYKKTCCPQGITTNPHKIATMVQDAAGAQIPGGVAGGGNTHLQEYQCSYSPWLWHWSTQATSLSTTPCPRVWSYLGQWHTHCIPRNCIPRNKTRLLVMRQDWRALST